MPFLRFSRDKRGYENFYLVHTVTRRGKSRNRILYWFRTPPGVKVGRLPFDDHMRRALEAQYPDVPFDWQQLSETPIPPPAPDVERWRERRRLERAAKQEAAAEAAAETADAASEAEAAIQTDADTLQSGAAAPAPPAAEGVQPAGRRKRRRGGRRGRSGTGSVSAGDTTRREGEGPVGSPDPLPAAAADRSDEDAD